MPSAPTPRRLQRKTEMAKQRKKAERGHQLPESLLLALKVRAAGRCEVCGDPFRYRCHGHHRKLRSQGGLDELVNLLLIHPACHSMLHMHRVWARENGFIVDSTRNPATVPILLHSQRKVRLHRDGTYIEAAA